MPESLPSSNKDSVPSAEYSSFDFVKLIISQIEQRKIAKTIEPLMVFMQNPGMIDSQESEILEQLIFDYQGKRTSPMFVDVFKAAVNNFFREAHKRHLLHRKMGMEGFGPLTPN